MSWQTIVISILGLVVIYGAVQYRAIKKLVKDVADALEDDQLTKEEISSIIADGVGIFNGFKKLFGK